MRIVLTGGGTGGHVMPFEAIIEALRTIHLKEKMTLPPFLEPDELELFFVGVTTPEGDALFQKYDVPSIHIPSGKKRRYASLKNIIDLFCKLPWGIVVALYRMWQIMPDVVVSKGGYGSVPAVLAASFYRIPILLHESDVVPGSSNMFLMKFASAITLGFAVARQYLATWPHKLFVTGTPVRMFLSNEQKKGAKASFGLAEEDKVVLVMGGSQGAEQINEALLGSLSDIVEKTAVIHLTGEAHFAAVSKVAEEILADSSRKEKYKPYAHLTTQMASALLAADAAVTRAGASSLAEIARLRIPSLVIPLDGAANDHQRKNALAFEAAGGALVLDPTNVSPNLVKQSILRLVSDEELRTTLKNNLAALDFPNAALEIASLVFKLASGFRPSKKQV
jgi:UDP-N-acetylglucosamine--N-acetylmuramyl-(pentapeptide) pyrophosphoryl-undecaprenol N-acetylglucosamine transferase